MYMHLHLQYVSPKCQCYWVFGHFHHPDDPQYDCLAEPNKFHWNKQPMANRC